MEHKMLYPMIVTLVLLTGCQSFVAMSHDELKREYIKKSEAEQNLRNVQDEYNRKISDKENQVSTAKDNVINGQDKQIQAAADALYSVNQATYQFPQLGALEFTKDTTLRGMSALGKPPTVKEIIEGGERLKKYITSYASNNLEEIKKLKDENAKLLAQNEILVTNTQEAKSEVKKLTEEKAKLREEKESAVSVAQNNLNQANNNLQQKTQEALDAETRAKEKAEKLQETKREIMIWCGIGAALAMVGAIYSPVGKGGMTLISAILGFVAIAIMYIEPWMVLTVGLVGAFSALAYMLYRHHLSESSNENIINAIQDVKEKSGDSYDVLKKSLVEWNTKYQKNGRGELEEVPDHKVMNYIDSKLAEYGRLTKKK